MECSALAFWAGNCTWIKQGSLVSISYYVNISKESTSHAAISDKPFRETQDSEVLGFRNINHLAQTEMVEDGVSSGCRR